MATWVVISGSPYAQGKCTTAAKQLCALIEEVPGNVAQFYPVCQAVVHPCIGCDSCKDAGACIYQDVVEFIQRDIEGAAGVVVVSPIYFAGVPSQFKAFLDRFQPYFWKRQALLEAAGGGAGAFVDTTTETGADATTETSVKTAKPFTAGAESPVQLPKKRPLVIALVGEGEDPYGPDPAFVSVESALALANLRAVEKLAFIRQDDEEVLLQLSGVVLPLVKGERS